MATQGAFSFSINWASVNVLRFGALAGGLWYGFSKQRSLTHKVAHEKVTAKEANHKKLVEEAKIAFASHNDRKLAAEAAKEGVVTDSNSYKFNAEKYIDWGLARMEAESANDATANKKK
ncbi:hypothetical protein HK096_008265, partial [Nowakowskiella sp. JEL0078]